MVNDTSLSEQAGAEMGRQTPGDVACYVDPSHLRDSSVRGSHEDKPDAFAFDDTGKSPVYPAPDSAERNAANTLGRLNKHHDDAAANAGHMLLNDDDQQNPLDDDDETGFAKLEFPDGHYFIRHTNVVLGRNEDVYWEVMHTKKARQMQAQAALHQYEQEPSRASQQGDGAVQGSQSRSSQSLQGRPALPNNVSEYGGVVSYQADAADEDDAKYPRRRKRRSLAISKSSSNASVDPSKIQSGASLDNDAAFDSDAGSEHRTYAHLPVHTQRPEDIRLISRRHLSFEYDFKRACWELRVPGHGAVVNEQYVDQHQIIDLHHGDEILISSLQIIFKLPDDQGSPGLSQGTFSRREDESDVDDEHILNALEWASPARRLSNVFEDASSDPDDNDDVENAGRPKSKPKGKPKKAKIASQGGAPTQTKKERKKPKAADKPSLEPKKQDKVSPPVQIEPDSSLANVPVGELPAKRKGPGRPPKNGFVSKRDQAMAAKRQKEYERRGEVAPAYSDLIDMVRREQKARDQQKAMNNGDVALGAVLPSIETMENGNTTKTAAGSSSKATRKRSASEERERVSPSNPKKRKHPSLSPIPALDSLTEEQLAKPTTTNMTYVIMLNAILEEHPDGEADLPELYHLMKKKHPYYAYRAESSGWQSSVRHNLISNPRFQSSGKSGKGHFWRINYDESIEPAKQKQKQSQQSRQSTMQQPAQYRQAGYGNQHAQTNGYPQFNANQGAYSSPYDQPGQNGQYMGQHPIAGPSNASGQATEQPKTKWDIALEQFVHLQVEYFKNLTSATEEERKTRNDFYLASMNTLSEGFGSLENPKPDAVEGAIAATSQLPEPTDDLDRQMQLQLTELFTKGLVFDAARDRYERGQQEKKRAVAQEVDNAAPEGLNGDVPVAHSTATGPSSRADIIAPTQPPIFQSSLIPLPGDITMPAPTPAAETAPQLHEHGGVEIADGGVPVGSNDTGTATVPQSDSPQAIGTDALEWDGRIDLPMPDAETSHEKSEAA